MRMIAENCSYWNSSTIKLSSDCNNNIALMHSLSHHINKFEFKIHSVCLCVCVFYCISLSFTRYILFFLLLQRSYVCNTVSDFFFFHFSFIHFPRSIFYLLSCSQHAIYNMLLRIQLNNVGKLIYSSLYPFNFCNFFFHHFLCVLLLGFPFHFQF